MRILAGSDDSLRIWLNGVLIRSIPKTREATPDEDRIEGDRVALRPGENRLLVEVSQRTGEWGLYLRLEDPDGTWLALTDQGELARLEGAGNGGL